MSLFPILHDQFPSTVVESLLTQFLFPAGDSSSSLLSGQSWGVKACWPANSLGSSAWKAALAWRVAGLLSHLNTRTGLCALLSPVLGTWISPGIAIKVYVNTEAKDFRKRHQRGRYVSPN